MSRHPLTPAQQAEVVSLLPVARRCARAFGRRHDVPADDAWEAAVFGLIEAVQQWQPGGGAEKETFVRITVWRQLIDARRSYHARQRWDGIPAGDVESASAPDPVDHDAELWAYLTAGLTPRQQHVLRLRYVDGLSGGETARAVGVHQSRTSRAESDALEALRVRFQHDPVRFA